MAKTWYFQRLDWVGIAIAFVTVLTIIVMKITGNIEVGGNVGKCNLKADGDIIVNSDLSDMYNIDMEDKYKNDVADAIKSNNTSNIDFIAMVINDRNTLSFRLAKDDIDLSKIAEYFGGKGHKTAGSCVITNIVKMSIGGVKSIEKVVNYIEGEL